MAKTFLNTAPGDGYQSVLDEMDNKRHGDIDELRGYKSQQSGPLGSLAQYPGLPSRVTVLVVDDELSIAEMIGEVLDAAGYRVLQASNGRMALTIARREHPALVLTDRMMPEVDGIEFVRQLHTSPTTRDIPVVIMSSTRPQERAGDNASSHDRALDLLETKSIPGVSTVVVGSYQVGFLEKPFDIDALVDMVDTITADGSVSSHNR